MNKLCRNICLMYFIILSSAFAGVESVGNGGGASEQAIMIAGVRLNSYYKNCLAVSSCYQTHDLRLVLERTSVCEVPNIKHFRFEIPGQNSQLKSHSPYIYSNNEFILNRNFLYLNKSPLNTSEALGYLTRIYADYCNVLPFVSSGAFFDPIINYANAFGEQITVGKDSLFLPKKEWIRLKTFYSDLIVESQQQVVRIQCTTEDFNSCYLLSENETSQSEVFFSNLGVVEESLQNGIVRFSIEGLLGKNNSEKVAFQLKAEYKNGVLQRIYFMGRELSQNKIKNAY